MLAACGTPHPSAGPTPSPQGEDEIASALTHSGLCWAGQIVFHLLIIDQNIQKCVRWKNCVNYIQAINITQYFTPNAHLLSLFYT